MPRRFVTLDVFTGERFAGNPLAVVLDAEGLDTAAMQAIAREFNLPIVSIEALIKYRRLREKLVHRVAEADLPTRYGLGRNIRLDAAEVRALLIPAGGAR